MEKITSAIVFKAFDGTLFESEKECTYYEKKKKELLNNLKFYLVRHSPDLTETGLFTRDLLVAVYSTEGWHYEIVANYCTKRFGFLGPSVQGHRFQPYYTIILKDLKTFSKGVIEGIHGIRSCDRIVLSPIELEDFKEIERFDYMKEWGFE